MPSNQTIEKDDRTEIRVERNGHRIFSVELTDDGPRSCGGALLVELGTGERVQIFDPVRLFDEIWTHGKLAGMREEQAK